MYIKSDPKQRRGIRFTALVVVFVFTMTSVTWAAPVSSTIIDAVAPVVSSIDKLVIPAEMGTISKAYRGEREMGNGKREVAGVSRFPLADSRNDKTVILIQDAHAVIDAQENIAKILGHFQKNYGIRLTALEGAKGRLEPILLRTFPEPIVKRKILAGYEQRAELSGSEMAAVLQEEPGEYHGMEDWGLYEKNYFAYLRAQEKKEALLSRWNTFKQTLDAERAKVYDSKLNEFQEAREDFLTDRAALLDLVVYLSKFQNLFKTASEYQELPGLIASIGYEKSGKQDALVPHVRKIVDEFKMKYLRGLGVKTEMNFYNRYQAFLTGQITAGQMLQYLVQVGSENGKAVKLTPDLKKLLGHAELLSEIKGSRLNDELQRFLPAVEASLLKTPAQREMAEKYQKLYLLKEMIELELTHENLAKYQKEPDSYLNLITDSTFKQDFVPVTEFYQAALERDRAFMGRIETMMKDAKQKTVVVVAGGFHTNGLEHILKERGMAYAVVTPKIASLAGSENYAKVMKGEVSFKNYLKTTYFDALMRHAAKALVEALPIPDRVRTLKTWRDNVIRELAKEGRIAEAGKYLPYIDEILQSMPEAATAISSKCPKEEILDIVRKELEGFKKDSLDRMWKTFEFQLDIFTDGLKQLIAKKDLNTQTVSALLDRASQTKPTFVNTQGKLFLDSVPVFMDFLKLPVLSSASRGVDAAAIANAVANVQAPTEQILNALGAGVTASPSSVVAETAAGLIAQGKNFERVAPEVKSVAPAPLNEALNNVVATVLPNVPLEKAKAALAEAMDVALPGRILGISEIQEDQPSFAKPAAPEIRRSEMQVPSVVHETIATVTALAGAKGSRDASSYGFTGEIREAIASMGETVPFVKRSELRKITGLKVKEDSLELAVEDENGHPKILNLSKIGTGGFGEVYLRERGDSRGMADVVKIAYPVRKDIPNSRFGANSLKNEKRISQLLQEKGVTHVARVLAGTEAEDGRYAIWMEGPAASDLEKMRDQLDTASRITAMKLYVQKVAESLRAGVALHDLQPGNCLVVREKGVVKAIEVIDIAGAKVVSDEAGLDTWILDRRFRVPETTLKAMEKAVKKRNLTRENFLGLVSLLELLTTSYRFVLKDDFVSVGNRELETFANLYSKDVREKVLTILQKIRAFERFRDPTLFERTLSEEPGLKDADFAARQLDELAGLWERLSQLPISSNFEKNQTFPSAEIIPEYLKSSFKRQMKFDELFSAVQRFYQYRSSLPGLRFPEGYYVNNQNFPIRDFAVQKLDEAFQILKECRSMNIIKQWSSAAEALKTIEKVRELYVMLKALDPGREMDVDVVAHLSMAQAEFGKISPIQGALLRWLGSRFEDQNQTNGYGRMLQKMQDAIIKDVKIVPYQVAEASVTKSDATEPAGIVRTETRRREPEKEIKTQPIYRDTGSNQFQVKLMSALGAGLDFAKATIQRFFAGRTPEGKTRVNFASKSAETVRSETRQVAVEPADIAKFLSNLKLPANASVSTIGPGVGDKFLSGQIDWENEFHKQKAVAELNIYELHAKKLADTKTSVKSDSRINFSGKRFFGKKNSADVIVAMSVFSQPFLGKDRDKNEQDKIDLARSIATAIKPGGYLVLGYYKNADPREETLHEKYLQILREGGLDLTSVARGIDARHHWIMFHVTGKSRSELRNMLEIPKDITIVTNQETEVSIAKSAITKSTPVRSQSVQGSRRAKVIEMKKTNFGESLWKGFRNLVMPIILAASMFFGSTTQSLGWDLQRDDNRASEFLGSATQSLGWDPQRDDRRASEGEWYMGIKVTHSWGGESGRTSKRAASGNFEMDWPQRLGLAGVCAAGSALFHQQDEGVRNVLSHDAVEAVGFSVDNALLGGVSGLLVHSGKRLFAQTVDDGIGLRLLSRLPIDLNFSLRNNLIRGNDPLSRYKLGLGRIDVADLSSTYTRYTVSNVGNRNAAADAIVEHGEPYRISLKGDIPDASQKIQKINVGSKAWEKWYGSKGISRSRSELRTVAEAESRETFSVGIRLDRVVHSEWEDFLLGSTQPVMLSAGGAMTIPSEGQVAPKMASIVEIPQASGEIVARKTPVVVRPALIAKSIATALQKNPLAGTNTISGGTVGASVTSPGTTPSVSDEAARVKELRFALKQMTPDQNFRIFNLVLGGDPDADFDSKMEILSQVSFGEFLARLARLSEVSPQVFIDAAKENQIPVEVLATVVLQKTNFKPGAMEMSKNGTMVVGICLIDLQTANLSKYLKRAIQRKILPANTPVPFKLNNKDQRKALIRYLLDPVKNVRYEALMFAESAHATQNIVSRLVRVHGAQNGLLGMGTDLFKTLNGMRAFFAANNAGKRKVSTKEEAAVSRVPGTSDYSKMFPAGTYGADTVRYLQFLGSLSNPNGLRTTSVVSGNLSEAEKGSAPLVLGKEMQPAGVRVTSPEETTVRAGVRDDSRTAGEKKAPEVGVTKVLKTQTSNKQEPVVQSLQTAVEKPEIPAESVSREVKGEGKTRAETGVLVQTPVTRPAMEPMGQKSEIKTGELITERPVKAVDVAVEKGTEKVPSDLSQNTGAGRAEMKIDQDLLLSATGGDTAWIRELALKAGPDEVRRVLAAKVRSLLTERDGRFEIRMNDLMAKIQGLKDNELEASFLMQALPQFIMEIFGDFGMTDAKAAEIAAKAVTEKVTPAAATLTELKPANIVWDPVELAAMVRVRETLSVSVDRLPIDKQKAYSLVTCLDTGSKKDARTEKILNMLREFPWARLMPLFEKGKRGFFRQVWEGVAQVILPVGFRSNGAQLAAVRAIKGSNDSVICLWFQDLGVELDDAFALSAAEVENITTEELRDLAIEVVRATTLIFMAQDKTTQRAISHDSKQMLPLLKQYGILSCVKIGKNGQLFVDRDALTNYFATRQYFESAA
ncbi:MAG: hypothetical protein WC484_00515 [Candidatus Omnitrophota bacterium]